MTRDHAHMMAALPFDNKVSRSARPTLIPTHSSLATYVPAKGHGGPLLICLKQEGIRCINPEPAEQAEGKECRINGTMPNARRLSVGLMLPLT